MPVIRTSISIAASPERCFDLARDIQAHVETTGKTRERIVEAPDHPLLELGDEIEFEAVHLGVRQRLRSKIVEYDRPHRFVDQMQRGAFKRLRHIHLFEAEPTGTRMTDELDFASPFGPIGALVDKLFLARYMTRFLEARSKELKRMAEQ